MIGALLCKHGLHKWSRASVVPQPTFRLVGRVCLRDGCDERRVVAQDVWSEPVRLERVWADEIREHARTQGGAG